MTDKEIIKALECCIGYSECSKCPFNSGAAGTIECKSECMTEALGLIKRQKAEIERLEIQVIAYSKKNYIKGIKDFAERLKLHAYIVSDESQTGIIHRYSVVTANQIDNLVEEMIGEQE